MEVVCRSKGVLCSYVINNLRTYKERRLLLRPLGGDHRQDAVHKLQPMQRLQHELKAKVDVFVHVFLDDLFDRNVCHIQSRRKAGHRCGCAGVLLILHYE